MVSWLNISIALVFGNNGEYHLLAMFASMVSFSPHNSSREVGEYWIPILHGDTQVTSKLFNPTLLCDWMIECRMWAQVCLMQISETDCPLPPVQQSVLPKRGHTEELLQVSFCWSPNGTFSCAFSKAVFPLLIFNHILAQFVYVAFFFLSMRFQFSISLAEIHFTLIAFRLKS